LPNPVDLFRRLQKIGGGIVDIATQPARLAMRQTQLVIGDVQRRTQEFLGVFTKPNQHAKQLITEAESKQQEIEQTFATFEEHIDDTDTRHKFLANICRHALYLLEAEPNEDTKLKLKEAGVLLDMVPGSPFAGVGLQKVEVERLALYYQLPLPSTYIALPVANMHQPSHDF